jgi:hypothetical protein
MNNLPSSARKETQKVLLATGNTIESNDPEHFQYSETNVMHFYSIY